MDGAIKIVCRLCRQHNNKKSTTVNKNIMKKSLKITIWALVAIAVIVGGYFLWSFLSGEDDDLEIPWPGTVEGFPQPSRVEQRVATTLPEGEVVVSEEMSGTVLSKVSDDGVLVFYSWTNEKDEIFYIANNGIVKKGVLGTDEALSVQNVNALASAKASPGGSYVLVSFGSPVNLNWAIFSLEEGAWHTLPRTVTATWGEDDKTLFAIQEDSGSRSLVSVDVSELKAGLFSTSVITRNFLFKDVSLKYVSPHVYIMERPSGNYDGSVWQVDTNTGVLKSAVAKSPGLWLEWSQNDDFVFSFSTPDTFRINFQGRSIVPISVSLKTLPNKCAGLGDIIYCFVPAEDFFPPSWTTVMPDEYLQKTFFTIDRLFLHRLNLVSTEIVFSSAVEKIPAIDATNVFYSKDGLYFINRYDAGLYKLILPETSRP